MSISSNTSLFARTPLATTAEFAKCQWLDLALSAKANAPKLERLCWLNLEMKSGVLTQVVQVIAKPPATSFPLFAKLVTELQNKIWVMVSLRFPRIVAIIEEDVDVAIHPLDNQYTIAGARRPHFLRTCRGAVAAMGLFINPDIDVVDFVSLRFLHGQAPPLNYIGALKYGEDFSMIRHACLPVQEFHDNFQAVAAIIQKLPKLETLMVEANLVDLTLSDTLVLAFEFQDMYYIRPHRQRRSDMTIKVVDNGVSLVGMQAIGALFAQIANQTHQAGILETLGKVEMMFRQEQNFPDRVLGYFVYRNHQ